MSVIFGDGRAVDGQVIVLDAATAQPIAEFDANNASPLAFDDATGNLLVALFGGGVLTVDPRTGETIASLTTETVTNYIAIGMGGDVSLRSDPDGRPSPARSPTGPTS